VEANHFLMKTKHLPVEIEHPQLEMKHLQAAEKNFQLVTEHSEHCGALRSKNPSALTTIRGGCCRRAR